MTRTVTVLLAAATILGGAFICHAMPTGPDALPPPATGGSDCAAEPFPGPLARVLELSEAQKKQIRSILDEQRDKDRAQMGRETELHDQLRQLEQAAAFDEQRVKEAAMSLASLQAERMAARVKAHARIDALLTPAQRAIAEKMRPQKGERPPHRLGCGPDLGRGQGPAEPTERR